MSAIKIQLGERVRECQEEDLAVFEKQGYKAVAAKKKPVPRKASKSVEL